MKYNSTKPLETVAVDCVYCFYGAQRGATDLPYLTLPWGGQVVTPAQRWGYISSAQCAT